MLAAELTCVPSTQLDGDAGDTSCWKPGRQLFQGGFSLLPTHSCLQVPLRQPWDAESNSVRAVPSPYSIEVSSKTHCIMFKVLFRPVGFKSPLLNLTTAKKYAISRRTIRKASAGQRDAP